MSGNSISGLTGSNDCSGESSLLFPVPVPQMPDLSEMTGLECLNITEPIDDLGALALHVAQLTEVVRMLRAELEAFKDG